MADILKAPNGTPLTISSMGDELRRLEDKAGPHPHVTHMIRCPKCSDKAMVAAIGENGWAETCFACGHQDEGISDAPH